MKKYMDFVKLIKQQVEDLQKMVAVDKESIAGKRLESFDAQPKAMKIFGITIALIILISFVGINVWLFQ